jgi:hypothetical protein
MMSCPDELRQQSIQLRLSTYIEKMNISGLSELVNGIMSTFSRNEKLDLAQLLRA